MKTQTNISQIPIEIITHIFSFLPRRERFVCMWVSTKWKDAMNVPSLWRHLIVNLDEDFFDVSTIQLGIEYCRHIRSLEFKLDGPSPKDRMDWLNFPLKDIAKRTYRFLSIFLNQNLQLEKLSFVTCADFDRTKKLFYYLRMFLKTQHKLKELTFNGSHFSKNSLVNFISRAVSPKDSPIELLDIQNAYHENENLFMESTFCKCITIRNLTVLKIDLEAIVANNILGDFADGICEALKYIDIRVDIMNLFHISFWDFYSNLAWVKIVRRFPELKASLSFQDVLFYENKIEMILIPSMPLYSIRWINQLPSLSGNNFALLSNFQNRLERISVTSELDELDGFLCTVVGRFPRLQCIEFSGVINDVIKINEILKSNHFERISNYKICTEQGKKSKVILKNEKVLKAWRING